MARRRLARTAAAWRLPAMRMAMTMAMMKANVATMGGVAALAIGGFGDHIDEGAGAGADLLRPEDGVEVDGERGLVGTFVGSASPGRDIRIARGGSL